MSNEGIYIPPALRQQQQSGGKISDHVAKAYNLKASEPAQESRDKHSFQPQPKNEGTSRRFEGRDLGDIFNRHGSFFGGNTMISCPPESQLFSRENMNTANYDSYKDVQVQSTSKVAPLKDFQSLNVSKILHDNIAKCNFQQPTPVQQYAIPIAMTKVDVLVQANTGSGKTAAFAIPSVDRLLQTPPARQGERGSPATPRLLVILPTRELAQQTILNFFRLTHGTSIKCCVAYGGGENTREMILSLRRGADVLIGCPGKLIDFYEKRIYSLRSCQMVVIDEADRCLDMGFEPQLREIIYKLDLQQNHQTMLFSATFPNSIKQLCQQLLKDPERIVVGDQSTCDTIAQSVERVEEEYKFDKLLSYLEKEKDKVLVFCETKIKTAQITQQLRAQGTACEMFHGDQEQNERNTAIQNFKTKSRIMVATDCAQRGLDISNVKLVINYDCPRHIEDYIHRVGRTGRVGNDGTAVTFVNGDSSEQVVQLIVKEIEKVGQKVDGSVRDLTRRRYGGGGYSQKRQYSSGRQFTRETQSQPKFDSYRQNAPFKSTYRSPLKQEEAEDIEIEIEDDKKKKVAVHNEEDDAFSDV